jgi:uncharacterized protein
MTSGTSSPLSDGTSYGLPGTAVERIETHISMVFLIGERAYKLKRAVAFSYLDFSTTALRERFCRAELGLNRRTAPELYLGLRSITRRPDGVLAFGDGDNVVDWVVEMRRFAENDIFDRLAQSGRLTAGLMRDLTDVIAAFHAAAEVTAGYGGRAGIAETIAGNDANLLLSCPPLERERAEALRAQSTTKLAAVGSVLDRRRERGRVRRCHGDLHLRNICLFQGRPTLFDCIEFSDGMACIDVLYDLAFLVIDLTHRGFGDLANLVLNRYLDLSPDSDGLPALPLFLSVRAAVRAHVLAAVYRRNPAAETLREPQSYLSLAATLLQPHPPRLIAVAGLSGTGKSTLAQALAGRAAAGARRAGGSQRRPAQAALRPRRRRGCRPPPTTPRPRSTSIASCTMRSRPRSPLVTARSSMRPFCGRKSATRSPRRRIAASEGGIDENGRDGWCSAASSPWSSPVTFHRARHSSPPTATRFAPGARLRSRFVRPAISSCPTRSRRRSCDPLPRPSTRSPSGGERPPTPCTDSCRALTGMSAARKICRTPCSWMIRSGRSPPSS